MRLPIPSTFWELIEHRVALTPDAPFLRDERGRRLTFAEFRDSAERVAAGLLAEAGPITAPVAWQLATTLEAAVLEAALSRLGAVQGPGIPGLRHREVSAISRQMGVQLYITPGGFRGVDFSKLAHDATAELGVRVLDCPPVDEGLGLPCGDPATLPPPPHDPEAIRWVFYTSGTTADPKGARHTDHSAMSSSRALADVADLTPDDVVVVPVPITHIGGLMMLSSMLRSGAQACLVEIFDAVRTPAYAAEVGVSVLMTAPPMCQAYLDAQRAFGDTKLFPRLRVAMSGGSPVPHSLHHAVKSQLGGIGITPSWGLTECPSVTIVPLTSTDTQLSQTVGPPVQGMEVRVAGDDGPCPVGVEGELRVRGPALFKGYVDQSLNAAALDDNGFLRTGDLGVLDEHGYVRVTGRLKDIVIRNGENISAREVEDVLLTHPKVRDAAVIGLPHPRTGERCCAVVQLTPGISTLGLSEIIDFCQSAGLAQYKIPEQLEFVDSLPRNDLGKLQKHLLRATYVAGG